MEIKKSADIRGVREIRTYAGRVDAVGLPYLAFMKISCLEMERARREKEKSSALARIRNIDARIRDIENEKRAILEGLGISDKDAPKLSGRTTGRPVCAVAKDQFNISGKGAIRDKEGFKIRY
jgi:hypothetical protein